MRLLHAAGQARMIMISTSAAAGAALLLLAGCTGGSAAPTAIPAATQAPAATVAAAKPAASPAASAGSPAASPVAAPTGPAQVKLTQSATLGTLLTDAVGRTLYMFANDKDRMSNCYDNCQRTWPPLLTRGQPQAGQGVDVSKLSTTNRRDGATQVVYGDFPLYYFTPDTAPGDTKGQAVNNVWFVLGPDGQPRR